MTPNRAEERHPASVDPATTRDRLGGIISTAGKKRDTDGRLEGKEDGIGTGGRKTERGTAATVTRSANIDT